MSVPPVGFQVSGCQGAVGDEGVIGRVFAWVRASALSAVDMISVRACDVEIVLGAWLRGAGVGQWSRNEVMKTRGPP